MKHISEIEMEKYLQNRVGKLKKFNIGRHLRNCSECSGLLKKGREDMSFLEEVKEAVNDRQSTPSEQLEKDTLLKLHKKFNSHI